MYCIAEKKASEPAERGKMKDEREKRKEKRKLGIRN
jgi:hypothetical protein